MATDYQGGDPNEPGGGNSGGNGGDQGGDPTVPNPPGSGCTEIAIDSTGHLVTSGTYDCVDQAEADRRRALNSALNQPPPGGKTDGTGAGAGGGAGGGGLAARPDYGPAPKFDGPTWDGGPTFTWGEQWAAPSQADAYNDPGYQFGLSQSLKAIQMSAAAKGGLLTGGTDRALIDYGRSAATQQYGDVFNRNLQGYSTRFGTAKDTYDKNYAQSKNLYDANYNLAKDKFAPTFSEWLQQAHGADLGFAQSFQKWLHDNLSASDIWNSQNG